MNFFNYQKRGAANCGFLQQLQDFKTNRTSTLTSTLLRLGWRGKKLPPLGGNNALQPYRSVYYVQIGAEKNGNGTKESPYNNIHNIFENMDIYYATVFQFTVVHVYVSGDPITTPVLPFGYNEDGTESAEWKAKRDLFRHQIQRSFSIPTYGDSSASKAVYGYCGNLIIHNAVFSYNENSDVHYGRMLDYGYNTYSYLNYAEFPSGIVWENCKFNIIYSDVPDDMVPDAETAFVRRGDDRWDEDDLRGFTILELSKAVKKLHELAPDIFDSTYVTAVGGISFGNNAILLNSTFTARLGKSGRGGRAINKTDGYQYAGIGGYAIELNGPFAGDSNMVLINSELDMTFCGPGDGGDGYDVRPDYTEDSVTIHGSTGVSGGGSDYRIGIINIGAYSIRNSKINIKSYNSAKGGKGGDCKFDYSHVIQSRPTDDGEGGIGGVVATHINIEFNAFYMTNSVLNITHDSSNAASGLAGKNTKISIYSKNDESELLSSYTEPQRYYDGNDATRIDTDINIRYCKNSEINVNCEKIGNVLNASQPCVTLTGKDHYNVTLNVTYDLTYNHCRESDVVSGNDCIIPCVQLYTFQNMVDITETDTECIVTPYQIRNRVSQVTANIIYNNIPTELEADKLVEYGTERYVDQGQVKYRPKYRATRSEPSYRIIGFRDISGYVVFPNVTNENKSNLVLDGESDEFGLRINTTKFPELTCASYRGTYEKMYDSWSNDYPIGITISGAPAVYITETGQVFDGGDASSGAKWGPITIPAGTPGAAVAQDQWSGGVCLPENMTTILNFSTERIELNLI